MDETHTFFFPQDGSEWEWRAGTHRIEVLAKIDESEEEVELTSVRVELTPHFAEVMNHPRSGGVWFQWSRRLDEYVCFAEPYRKEGKARKLQG
ncbi:hypothetical protein [Urbifossiella limnaea]|uniref:hypothetical protein n=1 Tax=Urbifossiella limnaea TaxID=2528023 RepID=UPI0011AAF613|nr:hypothetical protein [Urbifossiella limnaea]